MSGPIPVTRSVGVVVLTQGTRPVELTAAVESVLAQQAVELDVVVVGNGWQPTGLPDGARGLALSENLGIPAGRNRGADAVQGEFVFFLDDDATIPSTTFLRDAIAMLDADRSIGLIQPRLADADGAATPSRWVPRTRDKDPRHSSAVFSCLEAAVLLPRSVFDAVGGWADPFFYAHEGIELAWRVWDQGRRAWYEASLEANHPVTEPTRHTAYYRLNARNRVWLARRNLPVPLIPLYVGSWTAIQVIRWWRKPEALRPWFGGWREGWRTDPGERRPLRWRTVWWMTRAGRPPVI
ncbi:glycosyl transferase [Plantibacter flavus]|uniref:glycosyltransferase family 2 protein n=1 Tax=Plantibacter flavus TaxID=150123 RepID=UPI0010C23098|nr:glycosyltransferase [Plantibacter flavus]TKJ98579.1 glycosyl transferase [Plantibacter flavus]